jgi:ADP-ribose diphosphatase
MPLPEFRRGHSSQANPLHKLIYSYRWLSIYEGFQTIPFIGCPDGVMMVPITPQGEVIMIQEPTAYENGATTLFLPAGGIAPGEAKEAAANRELQEEIGFSAAGFEFLAQVRPWVKYLNASINLYLARDLTTSRLLGDETYPIMQEYIPLADFERLITAGRLSDSSVIAALLLARQKLANEI